MEQEPPSLLSRNELSLTDAGTSSRQNIASQSFQVLMVERKS
ncbi:hypothetical protein ACFSJU_07365 [Paradesertivirga mongoliensis]|uniref:Uncharacterized protein n=1 Tax=Paradesertivirga mongoliensis TaxID=2100740 RepID=A0ABW4ZK67_9SPHI|nr:hypothetical protein [Pedobacter mongoliensis]